MDKEGGKGEMEKGKRERQKERKKERKRKRGRGREIDKVSGWEWDYITLKNNLYVNVLDIEK